MELRIDINNRRNQFAGIGRDYLCDFQDGIQYKFPYPVRYGQFERIANDIPEESPERLVCLKALHRAENVVLHHGQRKAGNLCREMHALALAEVKQLLAIVVCHFGCPASSIGAVCFEEAEREVRGEQSVPLSFSPTLREEQADGGSCKLHIDGAVGTPERPVVLGEPQFLKLGNNLTGCQVTPLGVVLGLAQFDHAQQVALDVAAGYQAHEIGIGKPAVHQQIVKADAALDGILHHLDGLVGLLHGVLPDTLLNTLACIVGGETLAALLVRQSLLLVRIAPLLSVKGEVEKQLAQPVTQQKGQALVAQYALMLQMREDLSDHLTPAATLGGIRVIDNQADRPVIPSLTAAPDLSEQLKIHRIQQLAPLDIAIIHKAIEHVLLTTEQAA